MALDGCQQTLQLNFKRNLRKKRKRGEPWKLLREWDTEFKKCPSWTSSRIPSEIASPSLCSQIVTSNYFVAIESGHSTNDYLIGESEISERSFEKNQLSCYKTRDILTVLKWEKAVFFCYDYV